MEPSDLHAHGQVRVAHTCSETGTGPGWRVLFVFAIYSGAEQAPCIYICCTLASSAFKGVQALLPVVVLPVQHPLLADGLRWGSPAVQLLHLAQNLTLAKHAFYTVF